VQKIIFIFLFLFFSFLSIHAQQVVTDPTAHADHELSYIQLVNQVAQFRESVVVLKDQLNVTEQVRDTMTDIRAAAAVVYNNTFGLVGEVNALIEEVKGIPQVMQDVASEFQQQVDCLYADMDKYQKAETIYQARYVFKGRDNGTVNSPWTRSDDWMDDDDPFISDKTDVQAGTFDALHLSENGCYVAYTAYNNEIWKIQKEQEVILSLEAEASQSEEELNKFKQRMKDLGEKVERTQESKESIDTIKAEIWEVVRLLTKMEYHLSNLVWKAYALDHDPMKLTGKAQLTDEQLEFLKKNNIDPKNSTANLDEMMRARRNLKRRATPSIF